MLPTQINIQLLKLHFICRALRLPTFTTKSPEKRRNVSRRSKVIPLIISSFQHIGELQGKISVEEQFFFKYSFISLFNKGSF